MGLFEALQTIGEDRKFGGKKCAIGSLLLVLDPKDRDALAEVLANEQVSSASISRLLQENNYDIRRFTVANHRRRQTGNGCRCS